MVDQEPKITWRRYDSYRARIPVEVLTQGLESGQWSEGTAGWFIELETRMTDAEKSGRVFRQTAEGRLLVAMFQERFPTVREVFSRPPDYVARLQEQKQEIAEWRQTVSPGFLEEQAEKTLAPLADFERKVMRLGWGLDDGRSRTQAEVGRALNPPLSRWQVGRIERRAKSKMGLPQKPKKLRDYLE